MLNISFLPDMRWEETLIIVMELPVRIMFGIRLDIEIIRLMLVLIFF